MTVMDKIAYAAVDAFTAIPFAGNPAAVVVLPGPEYPPDDVLLKLAREFNLSETAFLIRRGAADYRLRWFSPTVEIDLCGHATLASAHFLFSTKAVSSSEAVHFESVKSGVLIAKQMADGKVELNFPDNVPVDVTDKGQRATLAACLNVSVEKIAYLGKARGSLLVEVTADVEIETILPDFPAVAKQDANIVIVTSTPAEKHIAAGRDFVSRVFAPNLGINEDPVTGAAHCTLICYWSNNLRRQGQMLTAYQASERSGTLHVTWDKAAGRVRLAGNAVTVANGEMLFPKA
ncbi:hypothetical protein HDU86_002281 [Geranomyces michiganensis]|nr:hypothetical protein HDU86_002281 [Geranomyces michiganensis]